ncbi:MAG: phosphatidate cytidylyltransferase [Treponema sp.]|jgi:phosphatidate cytidylyltransferase|nr:phosphatidate cytidylyltransferase [Treponema sp.]
MKKIIERLLMFIIAVPAVIALVIFIPYHHNLAMNIVAIFLSGIGALELSSMLKKKNIFITKVESFIYGILAPLSLTLHISFNLPEWIVPTFVMAGVGWALLSGVFSRSAEIENAVNKVIGGFSLLVYPGFFMYWLIKMNVWENNYAILIFLLITFATDSLGWFFGSLFGEKNRGIIAVSPNKSIAGFIGGILGSVIVPVCAVLIYSGVFPLSEEAPLSNLILISLIIGFCTGIAAALGDLAESAIKRSCDFKDSGNLMLGRGGILDSIDSIVVAAPVFYFLYCLFI